MDSGERGMNSVAMTPIKPQKEYWPSPGSNQPPPVLKSATLPTELWGSEKKKLKYKSIPKIIQCHVSTRAQN